MVRLIDRFIAKCYGATPIKTGLFAFISYIKIKEFFKNITTVQHGSDTVVRVKSIERRK